MSRRPSGSHSFHSTYQYRPRIDVNRPGAAAVPRSAAPQITSFGDREKSPSARPAPCRPDGSPWVYFGPAWKKSKIRRAPSALMPGTLHRSASDARSISFSVPK